ncbi:hypothetical protein [Microbispora rosea]
MPLLDAIKRRAEIHMDDAEAARQAYDRRSDPWDVSGGPCQTLPNLDDLQSRRLPSLKGGPTNHRRGGRRTMGVPEVVYRGDNLASDLERAGLTEEDLLLLAELAKGVTADRVGRSLDVSGRTVRRRLRCICDRIGVATAIEAVAWAARRRLI